jgi:hypothetical protein
MSNFVEISEQIEHLSKRIDESFSRVWLSTADASRYCGVHPKTIFRAIRRGDLRVSQKLGKNLFRRSWLDSWLGG